MSLRDGRLETSADDLELGIGLRVVHDGSFGFAATVELDADAAAELADQAVATARATAPVFSERVELADEALPRRSRMDLCLRPGPARTCPWQRRWPCSRSGAVASSAHPAWTT